MTAYCVVTAIYDSVEADTTTLTLSQRPLIVFTEQALVARIRKIAPHALIRVHERQNSLLLLALAAQEHAQYKCYIWMDHSLGDITKGVPNPPLNTLDWSQELLTVTVIDPDKHMANGLWSVGAKLMDQWVDYITEQEDLDQGRPDEILARFVDKYPEKCQFFFGDYRSQLANRMNGGLIVYDTEVAKAVIHRANLKAKNRMAAAGYRLLIRDDMTAAELFRTLEMLYIHTWYFDKDEAKRIAEFIMAEPKFAEYLRAEIANFRTLFSFVGIVP